MKLERKIEARSWRNVRNLDFVLRLVKKNYMIIFLKDHSYYCLDSRLKGADYKQKSSNERWGGWTLGMTVKMETGVWSQRVYWEDRPWRT